jgi:hypothetical protein
MIDIFQVVVPRNVAYHVKVIATNKGNPNITSITDLTRDELKIALGDVNAAVIGKATAKILERLITPP